MSISGSWEWEEEEVTTEEGSEAPGAHPRSQNSLNVADISRESLRSTPPSMSLVAVPPPTALPPPPVLPPSAAPLSPTTVRVAPTPPRFGEHQMSESVEYEYEDEDEDDSSAVRTRATAPSMRLPAHAVVASPTPPVPAPVPAPALAVTPPPAPVVAAVAALPASNFSHPPAPVSPRAPPQAPAPSVTAVNRYGEISHPPASYMPAAPAAAHQAKNIRCPHCGGNVMQDREHVPGRQYRRYMHYTFENVCVLQ